MVESDRWVGGDILAFELSLRRECLEVCACELDVDAALTIYGCRVVDMGVLAKARHWRLEMRLGLDADLDAGDWATSWHRRNRSSDADGAGKPCEAFIACVRRQT